MGPDEILSREFSDDFVTKMRNRVIQGYMKYGPCRQSLLNLDFRETVKLRLDAFERTGNTEFLVDAANFLMFAYMHPETVHSEGHFRATSTEESPSVAWTAQECKGPGRE